MGKIKRATSFVVIILWAVFWLAPNTVFADYVAFQNKAPIGELNLSPYAMYGFGSTAEMDGFRYDATTTVTQFDRIDIPLCAINNPYTGQIQLEVRTTSSTSPVVASSTVMNTSGNVSDCSLGLTYLNATTTTFVLNNKLQWVNGVQMFFTLRAVGGGLATFYLSARASGSEDSGSYTFLNDGSPYFDGMNYFNVYVTGRGLGTAPTTGSFYNASSTVVVCETFDVGCYFSSALSWAFIPQEGAFDPFISYADQIKNKPPFGYFTLTSDMISDMGTSTPAFNLASVEPINNLIFDPIRTGLLWIIPFASAFWIYKRLTHVDV